MSHLSSKEILCRRLEEVFNDFFISQLKKFDYDDYDGMMDYARYYRKLLHKTKDNIYNDFIKIKDKDNGINSSLIMRNIKSFVRLVKN